ncbi:MAG: stress response translation initiation inhibitor YciH, partial [Acidobacteriota bacterium]
TRGRKGKGVTVVTGLDLEPAELVKLGGELKKACGSGGTVKSGAVEIQGDHRDRVIEDLRRRGWRVKKAGG